MFLAAAAPRRAEASTGWMKESRSDHRSTHERVPSWEPLSATMTSHSPGTYASTGHGLMFDPRHSAPDRQHHPDQGRFACPPLVRHADLIDDRCYPIEMRTA